MARRASSGLNPVAIIAGAVVVVAAIFGGKVLMGGKSESFDGVPELNIEDLLENGNSLRRNIYVIRGEIDEKLQFSSRGQLVSVRVKGGRDDEFIGIEIPSKFDKMNIDTKQEYVFKVEFQQGGIAVATGIEKL